MKLEEIQRMVQADSVIDDTELDIESLKLPQLHNKYLNIYHNEKLLLSKYTGKMDEDTLSDLGIEPFQLKILKQDIDKYMESDEDIIELNLKVEYQKEKVSYLESIIKEVSNRHWKIKNAIEWRKFVSGV